MKETRKTREEIYAEYAESGCERLEVGLREHLHANCAQWRQFLNLLLPMLGLSLSISGVLFFFAYNWADLHKFVKLGLLESMLLLLVALAFFTRWSPLMKQLLLTAASFLVGILFAVFGQIYQTGADTYQLFLGWTLFITLWAVATAYPWLWLLWLGLVNTTLYFYLGQTSSLSDGMLLFLKSIPALSCLLAAAIAEVLYAYGKVRKRQEWFIYTVGLAGFLFMTWNMTECIIERYEYLHVRLPLLLLTYGAGLLWGFRNRFSFYIASILFSMLVLLDVLLTRYLFSSWDDSHVILLVTLVTVAGTTAIVLLLLNLKKLQHGTTTD